MMALSGVRSSWLMFARNCDLCWLASASCAVRLLKLLEQPGVLDGDDGLVGERLQQRDLCAGERPASCRRDQRARRSLSPSRSSGTASSGADAEPVR